VNRPDVATALGDSRFSRSGWTFGWDTSQTGAGSHSLFVYAHSTAGNSWFSSAQMVRVGLGEEAAIVVDRVPGRDRPTDQVRFGGWAADRRASSGTGISRVDVYLDGPAGVGAFLGTANYGESRPDVASTLQRADFTRSGWSLPWTPGATAGGFHELYAYAYAPRTGAWSVQTVEFVLDQAPPRLTIDKPAGDARVSGTMEVTGWAADRRAENGTGVDRVQLYLDGGPGVGTYLGDAEYGTARPDVATALRGSQFANSGWSFAWNPGEVTAGRHMLHVVAHSSLSGLWAEQARVVVIDRPTLLQVESPVHNARISRDSPFVMTGWAIDRAATGSGPGIEMVQIYLDGPSGVGSYLGTARYGLPRPDVAALYGSPRFSNSGWTLTWQPSAFSTGPHTLYVYAYSAGLGTRELATRPFTV
jgi:hypothetical protein